MISDIARLIWLQAEKIAEIEGLTTVEVHHKNKIYTFTKLETPEKTVRFYGIISR